MSNTIYKTIELTGTSTMNIEDAVNGAVERAGQTVHNLGWFEVVETRGRIENNKVNLWQVTLKIGFTLD